VLGPLNLCNSSHHLCCFDGRSCEWRPSRCRRWYWWSMALERVASRMPSSGAHAAHRIVCWCLRLESVKRKTDVNQHLKKHVYRIHMKKIEHVQHTHYFTYSIPNESKWHELHIVKWYWQCVRNHRQLSGLRCVLVEREPRRQHFGQGRKLARFWLEYGRISMHPGGGAGSVIQPYSYIQLQYITIIGLLLWHLGLLHNDTQKPWSWIKNWLKEGSIVFLPFHEILRKF